VAQNEDSLVTIFLLVFFVLLAIKAIHIMGKYLAESAVEKQRQENHLLLALDRLNRLQAEKNELKYPTPLFKGEWAGRN
jgi:hypothetical protein